MGGTGRSLVTKGFTCPPALSVMRYANEGFSGQNDTNLIVFGKITLFCSCCMLGEQKAETRLRDWMEGWALDSVCLGSNPASWL